jgi:hypothetical protein
MHPVVHVEPSLDGRWVVTIDRETPQSICGSAYEAETAAREHARAIGADTIVLHDRYSRVRVWTLARPHDSHQ